MNKESKWTGSKRRYFLVFNQDAIPVGATIVGHMRSNATFQSYTGK